MRYLAANNDDWTIELNIKMEKIRDAAQALVDLIDSDLADFIPKEETTIR